MPSSNDLFSTSITLTNVAIGPTRNNFILPMIMPELDSLEKTATIFSIDPNEEARRAVATNRAPGSEAKTADLAVSRPVTFNCTDHALIGYVPDEHKAITNPAILASIQNIQFLMDKINLELEIDGKVLLDANVNETAKSAAWATAATGTPIADIRTEMNAIELNSGVTPNRVAMDISVLRTVADTAEFLDHVKHTQIPTMNAIANSLANILGIEQVVVANIALKNTATKGASETMGRIWSDDVYVYYAEPPQLSTRNVGQITLWTSGDMAGGGTGGIINGVRVETFREAKRRSDGVLAGKYYDLNMLTAVSCRRLSGTIA